MEEFKRSCECDRRDCPICFPQFMTFQQVTSRVASRQVTFRQVPFRQLEIDSLDQGMNELRHGYSADLEVD